MKFIGIILCSLIFSFSALAQGDIIPIYEFRIGGLLGGVQNGKWVKADVTAKQMGDSEEYVIAGFEGVEEGGVTWGKKPSIEEPCEDFYYVKMETEQKYGIAIGSKAKWNFVPRVPKPIGLNSPQYKAIVSSVLKQEKLPNSRAKITQAYRVDLEGDGQEEVLISATSYTGGQYEVGANKGDYSFIMLRKIVNGKPQNIILGGEFYTKKPESAASNTFEFSAIADLNGDGKMEIIAYIYYYEGGASTVYEMKNGKPIEVEELSVGCGV